MRNNLHLNLLYRFVEGETPEDTLGSYYKIVQFFSEVGMVSAGVISKTYQNFDTDFRSENEISFKTLDELGHFAIEICKELAAPEVFLLSVQDYNIGLDSCSDIRGFREIFRRYGTSVENPEGSHRRKNLFGKIFN